MTEGYIVTVEVFVSADAVSYTRGIATLYTSEKEKPDLAALLVERHLAGVSHEIKNVRKVK